MTSKQVEAKLTELIHREPFVPFVVELRVGQSLEISDPGVAFDDTGALFYGSDGGLVEFEFKHVSNIRLPTPESVA